MFPFKSHCMVIESKLTELEFKSRVEAGLSKRSRARINTGWILHETRNKNTIILKYRQGFYGNSFRPVVVCSWYRDGNKTIFNSYLRPHRYLFFINITPVIFGIYISYQISNILPLIITVLITLVLIYVFGYLCYKIDEKRVVDEYKKLLA